jgi:hypothetical protein
MTEMDASFVANVSEDWDIPESIHHGNGPSVPSEPDAVFDPERYDCWTLDQIVARLGGATLSLLKRGTLTSLVARRELGGLLVAASKLVTTFAEQTHLFRRVLDLDYSDARRHMKVWLFRPRVEKMLVDRALS